MSDLVKIGKMLIDDGCAIISQQTKHHLLSPAVKLPGLFVGTKAEQPFFQFGLGCARFPNGRYGVRSNSLGQCCALRFESETGMVLAVGINADAAYLRDFTIDKLFNAMLPEDAPIIAKLFPKQKNKLPLKKLVGAYQGAQHHSFTVSLENGQLALRNGHNLGGNQNNSNEPLLLLSKDKQGFIKPLDSTLPVSIGFVKSLVPKKYHLLVGENVFVAV